MTSRGPKQRKGCDGGGKRWRDALIWYSYIHSGDITINLLHFKFSLGTQRRNFDKQLSLFLMPHAAIYSNIWLHCNTLLSVTKLCYRLPVTHCNQKLAKKPFFFIPVKYIYSSPLRSSVKFFNTSIREDIAYASRQPPPLPEFVAHSETTLIFWMSVKFSSLKGFYEWTVEILFENLKLVWKSIRYPEHFNSIFPVKSFHTFSVVILIYLLITDRISDNP